METIKWSFYWNDKPEKIKRTTITGQQQFGGTGLIDIRKKLQALKLNVITKYMKSTGKWKYFFDYCISHASGNNQLGWYILNNPKVIVSSAQTFYRDLIPLFQIAGGDFNETFSCINETRNLPLWKNSIITGHPNSEMDSKILKPQGITCLNQVLINEEIISHDILATKCNILPINAGRIVSGLRKNIRTEYVKENREGPPNNYLCNASINDNLGNGNINISDLNVKIIYLNLVQSFFTPPVAEKAWERALHFISSPPWNTIWINNGCSLLDHDDRDLWYKLKQRILPTKNKLKHMGITSDDLCPLCNIEKETIEHLFLTCLVHIDAWLFVENLIKKYTQKQCFYLTDATRILGIGDNVDNMSIFLIGRLHRVIWNIRCNIQMGCQSRNTNILTVYINNIKKFIKLEKSRLPEFVFESTYAKNSILCTVVNKQIKFNI